MRVHRTGDRCRAGWRAPQSPRWPAAGSRAKQKWRSPDGQPRRILSGAMSGTLRNSRRLGPWLAIIGIVALAAAGCGSGNSDQSAQNVQEIKDQIQELQRYV